MNRILKIAPDIDIPDAKKIINTRKKIIHGYDDIDDVVVYVVATKHLQILKESIKKL